MKWVQFPTGVPNDPATSRILDEPYPENQQLMGCYFVLLRIVAENVQHETTSTAYSARRWAQLLASTEEDVPKQFARLVALGTIDVVEDSEGRLDVSVLALGFYADEWTRRKENGANEKRNERRARKRSNPALAPHGSGATANGSTPKKGSEASLSGKKKGKQTRRAPVPPAAPEGGGVRAALRRVFDEFIQTGNGTMPAQSAAFLKALRIGYPEDAEDLYAAWERVEYPLKPFHEDDLSPNEKSALQKYGLKFVDREIRCLCGSDLLLCSVKHGAHDLPASKTARNVVSS